jgi:hypothetical protein
MKIKERFVFGNHHWKRYTLMSVALKVAALMSLVLASGAQSHWK